jgi:hypothetical protein
MNVPSRTGEALVIQVGVPGGCAGPATYHIDFVPALGQAPSGKFEPWFARLQTVASLKDGWDSYGSPRPSPEAVAAARLYLTTLELLDWGPTRVEASAMGGVGVTHRQGARKVYVELYNNGTVHALFSDRTGPTPTMETTPVGADVTSFYRFIRKAREYLHG